MIALSCLVTCAIGLVPNKNLNDPFGNKPTNEILIRLDWFLKFLKRNACT